MKGYQEESEKRLGASSGAPRRPCAVKDRCLWRVRPSALRRPMELHRASRFPRPPGGGCGAMDQRVEAVIGRRAIDDSCRARGARWSQLLHLLNMAQDPTRQVVAPVC
jgi:hypothetical protein